MRHLPLLAAALAIAGPLIAVAQEAAAPQYSASDFAKSMLSTPPPCTAVNEAACREAAKSRGFSLPTLSAKRVSAPAPTKPTRPGARTAAAIAPAPKIVGGADILVTFRSGSAEITPQGRANLASVAEGLKRPSLAARRFEIAGYTDASGKAAINGPLSQSRAEAVRTFLTGQGVEPDRLTATGYGADSLLDPAAPTDERNRRVEIHRLD